jgi:hypothetical protein
MSTPCQRKRSFLLTWQASAQSYSEAVTALVESLGNISVAEYEMLKKKVDRERIRTADARNAFEVHAEEHGC